ncbi:MAG: hypothetical protein JKY93_00975 [Gammaproteobacteria bacterium]|nr:hypothetical protein [Gammaproteobacteria bacterium]
MKQDTYQNLKQFISPNTQGEEFANDNAQEIYVGDDVMFTSDSGEIYFGTVRQIIRRGMVEKPDQYLVQFIDTRRYCSFKSLQKFKKA